MLLLPVPAWAATYWVQSGGTNSSCAAASGSSNPGLFRNSLTNGVACLSSGDTLVITANAPYSGFINLDNVPSGGGSFGTATTIRGEFGSNRPHLNGTINDGCVTSFATRDAWIIVKWLECGGAPGNYLGAGAGMGSRNTRRIRWEENLLAYIDINGFSDGLGSHNEYIRNEVHHIARVLDGCNGTCGSSGHPLYLNGTNHIVDGNHFHHCRDADDGATSWTCYGIHNHFVDGSSDGDWIVRNNKLEFVEIGMLLIGAGHQVYNNILANNSVVAIFNSTNGALYYHNTIYGNAGCAFYQNEGGGTATATNNIMSNNGNNTINGCLDAGSITGTNNLGGNLIGMFKEPNGGDFHLVADDNGGVNLIGAVPLDIEGSTRGTPPDRGAFEFDAADEPPQPIGPVVNYKCNLNFLDDENGFTATQTGGVLNNGPPIVSGNSCVFDGVDALLTAPNDPAFRPANVGFAIWPQNLVAPAEYCHIMRVGNTAVMGLQSDGKFYCFINNGPTVVSPSSVLGSVHLLGCGYDKATGMLRLWDNNANPASLNVGADTPLVYGGSETLEIGGIPGEPGHFCQFNADNIRMNDDAWTALGMQQVFDERVPSMGTSSTHWIFSQPDSAEITLIAGQGVDAPNITLNRSAEVLQSWNIKRNGSTTALHYSLECSLNSLVTFVTLTTSCASNPACIANDSVKNSGDATADVDGLPNDGFTFVPGRYEVDSVGAFTTTLLDGQVTKWRYGLSFNQSLADQDIVRCRVAGMDSYPATLPTITISVPIPSTGSDLKGGTFIGVTVR